MVLKTPFHDPLTQRRLLIPKPDTDGSASSRSILAAYTEKIQNQFAESPDAHARLEFVLNTYHWLLARPWLTGQVKQAFTSRVREALGVAIDLFRDLTLNETSRVQGWYEGRPTSNGVERLAKILVALIHKLEVALLEGALSN